MSKPDSSNKNNTSTLSTLNQTNYYTARAGNNSEIRPKSVNLVYASKPYRKQVAQWGQSSSTWQHSSRKQTFSKDKRFRTAFPNSLDILEPDISGERCMRAASFGSGQKVPISKTVLRNAKQKPSPNAYSMASLDEMTRNPSKGRTFANNWDKYEKVYLGFRKDVYSGHFTADNPPAKYQVRDSPGKRVRAFTAYGRQRTFTQKMSDMMRGVPGPGYLLNDRQLYNTIGATNCSFTSDHRLDLSAPANFNPGSQYNIHGFCDKYRQTRRKMCGQN